MTRNYEPALLIDKMCSQADTDRQTDRQLALLNLNILVGRNSAMWKWWNMIQSKDVPMIMSMTINSQSRKTSQSNGVISTRHTNESTYYGKTASILSSISIKRIDEKWRSTKPTPDHDFAWCWFCHWTFDLKALNGYNSILYWSDFSKLNQSAK